MKNYDSFAGEIFHTRHWRSDAVPSPSRAEMCVAMLVHAHSLAIDRGGAQYVRIELDMRAGLPAFTVIGIGSGAARDMRERVQAAILNSGFTFPRQRVTANVAPAAMRSSANELDLALAACVLGVSDHVDPARLSRVALFAELGLGGELRPCAQIAIAAEAVGWTPLAGLVVAHANLDEARSRARIPTVGAVDLREVVALLAPRKQPAHERSGAARAGARTQPALAPRRPAARR
jgi:magnesium chelatase family protein